VKQLYPVLLQFRAPKEYVEALADAAAAEHETRSSYVRRLIRDDMARRQSEEANDGQRDYGEPRGMVAA